MHGIAALPEMQMYSSHGTGRRRRAMMAAAMANGAYAPTQMYGSAMPGMCDPRVGMMDAQSAGMGYSVLPMDRNRYGAGVGVAVGMTGGLVAAAAGALVGGLVFGLPGALIGGVGGFLLASRLRH